MPSLEQSIANRPAGFSIAGYSTAFCRRCLRIGATVVAFVAATLSAAPAIGSSVVSFPSAIGASGASALGASTIGQLIDFGIAHYRDPSIRFLPKDPANVVTDISDDQIIAISTRLLTALNSTSPSPTTWSDLKKLDALAPGMGASAAMLILDGVRAFAHLAQGAAAYSEFGAGSPPLRLAVGKLHGDLIDFNVSLAGFARYVLAIDTTPPFLRKFAADYNRFWDDLLFGGVLAIPPDELSAAKVILELANVRWVTGAAVATSATPLSGGDPGGTPVLYSAPLAPAGLDNGVIPEPGTFALAALGILGMLALGWQRRRDAV
jgi:hypothetical protein